MLQWFKRHTQFLRDESSALSNNKNYKEIYQYRDNLFISHGEIVVRLNEIYKYPILIVYTDATPYRLPVIFPLRKTLTHSQVEELAKMKLGDLNSKVKEFIEFYYELRHQNNSGELCILERESLETNNNIYGISTVLSRVKDWYKGHVTGNYPPDSEETEFCSHFNFINSDTKIIYPISFFNTQYSEGDIYAWIYGIQPKGIYFPNDRYIYVGFYLEGFEKNRLIARINNISIKHLGLHEKLEYVADLYSEQEVVKKLVEDLKLLKAHWFQIEKEPKPFLKFQDLITIIGNGNYDNGVHRIKQIGKQTILNIPEFFYIGIRFPNKKGIQEFQLFKIHKSKNPPTNALVLHDTEEMAIRARIELYDFIEAIEGEKITEESYFERNGKRADYLILKNKSVNIIGVGAIGSEIADCLGKAGIGLLTLCDDQVLKAHNAVRHLAGLDNIGIPKVQAVGEILRKHNYFLNARASTLNLYNLDIADGDFPDESISISSIADDSVEGFINQQMVVSNKTVFYVRALRGGKVARIFRVVPGKDACFNCLTLYRNDNKEYIDIPEDEDYPTIRNECNNPIRPASAADLKLIASLASRIFLDNLQLGESEVNHWIWSSEVIKNTPIDISYKLYTQTIPVHEGCYYCNSDKKVSVTISSDLINYMQTLVRKKPGIETGGVLAGQIDADGNIYITDVSEPGPNATQSSYTFEKDILYCQKFLDDLYIKSDRKKYYVGEWHSHPNLNNRPSATDIRSLSEIAVEKHYLTDSPTMIILTNTGAPSCTVHPAGKRFYHTELKCKGML